jgi:hypothetical protein
LLRALCEIADQTLAIQTQTNQGNSYNGPMASQNSFGLELHDSAFDSVVHVEQTCLIALRPAYVYEVDGESGELGPCMTVNILFEFDHGCVDGVLGDLPNPILDGSLSVDAQLIEGLIPVPFDGQGAVSMKLFMWPDYREIAISARGLKARLDGVPRLEKNPIIAK